ncbi:MAG: 50S ribosomal protein L10 [Akkermansia sp.]
MNPDKRIIIDDLTARVNASPFLIVVDYTSITVPEFTNLRSALAACGAQCHVAKNNFMRTALTDAGLPDIGEHLVGQTAFVTGASDVAAAAKAINTFAKASKKAEYKVAILDGAILSADEIRAIGELPPARPVACQTPWHYQRGRFRSCPSYSGICGQRKRRQRRTRRLIPTP